MMLQAGELWGALIRDMLIAGITQMLSREKESESDTLNTIQCIFSCACIIIRRYKMYKILRGKSIIRRINVWLRYVKICWSVEISCS